MRAGARRGAGRLAWVRLWAVRARPLAGLRRRVAVPLPERGGAARRERAGALRRARVATYPPGSIPIPSPKINSS